MGRRPSPKRKRLKNTKENSLLLSYQEEIQNLLGGAHVSASIKTPLLEFAIDQAKVPGAVVPAAGKKGTGGATSSALNRPSNPEPGLEGLTAVVANNSSNSMACDSTYLLARDECYLEFFSGVKEQKRDNKLQDSTIEPVEALAICLNDYVNIFPDSQLLLIDIKPIVQRFFRAKARAVSEIWEKNSVMASPSSINGDRDRLSLSEDVKEVTKNIRSLLPTADSQKCKDPQKLPTVSLPYLQPYATIALANLLLAHGSPDGAVDVLTQWLHLWRCARGEFGSPTNRAKTCDRGPIPSADNFTEWFSIRAEASLNEILYSITGENNIVYRDFLRETAKHFADYARSPETYDRRISTPRNVSIIAEATNCEGDRKSNDFWDSVKLQLLRSLLQNENTLLRSELYFLSDFDWTEMINLLERSKTLTSFKIDCIYLAGKDKDFWTATLADYKVTYGLLGVAIAGRFAAMPAADLREKSAQVRKEAVQQLREGYRKLKDSATVIGKNLQPQTGTNHTLWRCTRPARRNEGGASCHFPACGISRYRPADRLLVRY
jgi:hypothetical protein